MKIRDGPDNDRPAPLQLPSGRRSFFWKNYKNVRRHLLYRFVLFEPLQTPSQFLRRLSFLNDYKGMTKQIPIEKLDRGTNIREEQDNEIMELVESIKKNGLLNPITVVQKGSRYEVVAGHRRFLALKILQEPWVECNVLEYAPNERELLCIQLQENCCRKNMSAWEYADLFTRLQSKEMKIKDIAKLCGKSEQWVYMQIEAEKCLERNGELNEETKKMTLSDVRKKFGSLAKNHKPYQLTQPVVVTHNSNVYSVRVNDKDAERELIEFLNAFKAKYQK